jgi:MFS family permease
VLAMLVAGAGFGALLGAPTRYIVTNETHEHTRAIGVGLLSQCLIVGQIVGSSLAGGIIGMATQEVVGYREAYLAFCAVALLALVLTAALKPRRQERREPIGEAA